jgi:hypothetical protein
MTMARTWSTVNGAGVARFAAAASLLAVLVATGDANAQGGETATAESLFRQGKQLMDAKDFARACPMLAESYRLDPATGALFALATCHEGEGKLASAWSRFADAGSRAQREGRADRVSAAKARMAAIEPKLSMLLIAVPDAVVALPGFELKRDGIVLGQALIGVSVPVDGGDHVIDVAAAGKRPWRTSVTIRPEKDKRTVSVPSLEDAAGAPAPAPVGAAPPSAGVAPAAGSGTETGATKLEVTSTRAENALTGIQIGGIVAGGLGVVGLAVGTVFGLTAIGKNNDSKNGCDKGVCTNADAFQARADARSAATISTVAVVAGGVLAAAGVTLLVMGKPKRSEQGNVSLSPSVTENQLGLGLRGTF